MSQLPKVEAMMSPLTTIASMSPLSKQVPSALETRIPLSLVRHFVQISKKLISLVYLLTDSAHAVFTPSSNFNTASMSNGAGSPKSGIHLDIAHHCLLLCLRGCDPLPCAESVMNSDSAASLISKRIPHQIFIRQAFP